MEHQDNQEYRYDQEHQVIQQHQGNQVHQDNSIPLGWQGSPGVILFAVTYNRIFYHSLVLVCPKELGIHADCNRNSIQEHSSNLICWCRLIALVSYLILLKILVHGAKSCLKQYLFPKLLSYLEIVYNYLVHGEFGQKITFSTFSVREPPEKVIQAHCSSMVICGQPSQANPLPPHSFKL